MKFFGEFKAPRFHLAAYKKEVDKRLSALLQAGVREFVEGLLEKVPVWSGMARGSIQPLGRLVDKAIFARAKPGVTSREARGRALGRARLDQRPFHYAFFFSSDVPHYIFNEFHDARALGVKLIHPTPWHSLERGRARFIQLVRGRRLPRPFQKRFFTAKRIRIR